jgi:DNA-binding MarR family transcriptional regulator
VTAGTDQSLDARLVAGLGKVAIALRSRAQEGATALGVSPTQGQILALLRREGPRRSADIARMLALSAPTVSDAVGALLAKKLVARRRARADGRARLVALTPRGRADAERSAGWTEFLADALATLDSKDREALLGILVRLVATLQRQGRVPLSGMCVSCAYFRRDLHVGHARPHHCAFIDAPLAAAELRFDCPDHR